jgi:hypothetical protein
MNDRDLRTFDALTEERVSQIIDKKILLSVFIESSSGFPAKVTGYDHIL